jgi:hypothetical protein
VGEHPEMDKSSQDDHLEIKIDGISSSNNGDQHNENKHHSQEDFNNPQKKFDR